MITNDKISVIISSYNSDKYIYETLESILNQSYTNLEVIIIDDGSTDKTVELIKNNFFNNNITLLLRKHTGNIGKNLNDGIKYSKGKYVCVCGADDKWKYTKLEEQLKYISKYNFISTNALIIDDKNNVVEFEYFNNFERNKEICLSDLLYVNYVIASSILMKKSKFLECGCFNEEIGNRAEDYYLWLNVTERYPIYFINKCLVYYRKHKSNMSFKSVFDIEQLILRSIELRKKYLKYNEKVSNSALNGLIIEYSKLINLFIKSKNISKVKEYSNIIKDYIVNKYSLQFIKYRLIYLAANIITTIIRK